MTKLLGTISFIVVGTFCAVAISACLAGVAWLIIIALKATLALP